MHYQLNSTSLGTISNSQHDHHSFVTAALKRQTTEEIMDDVVGALFQTNEDVQFYTEECKKRKFSHEKTHSSSSAKSESFSSEENALDYQSHNNSPLVILTASSSHSTKKIKHRLKKEESIENSDLLNDDVIVSGEKINKEEARKEKSRQRANTFQNRKDKHIEELEQLQKATLILGKKLSNTVLSVLTTPILENGDIESAPKTKNRFHVENCEKQYESVRKTQLWIENTVTSLVENTFKKEETLKDLQTRVMMLADVIAKLQAENDQLRMRETCQHPSNVNHVARVSPDVTDN